MQQNQESLVSAPAAPASEEPAEQTQQEPAPPKKPKPRQAEADTPAPRITFEQMVHDFGEVGPATKKTAEFKFTNTGDAVLEIQQVQRCCGAVTKLARKQYAPGESGVLEVTYAFASKPMTMTKQVQVYSNDPQQQQVSLTIKAEVVCKVDCNPEILQLSLQKENGGCGEITLTSLDGRPFSIAGFTCTSNVITADFDPDMEAAKFILAPKVDMEKAQMHPKGLINIQLTHPEGKYVGLKYELLSEFTINPSIIVIFNNEPEKPIVRKILVFNNYGKEFEIESVASKNNAVAIRVLEQTKITKGYQLEVEITPPAAEGKLKFTDTFLISIKGGEKLAVTCNGYYPKSKPKPEIQ
ncbi:MAG: hypothetical protein A2168_04710 [Planctomycetes bacterium RBG_13_50_24]|nr:MAG: hypothetical protein A2168_04710 [Planctomycetes bacterium RBG_13_50_24]